MIPLKSYTRSINESTESITSRVDRETTTELSVFNGNYTPAFNSVVGDRIVLVIGNTDTNTYWNVLCVVTQLTDSTFTYVGVWAEDTNQPI